MCEIAQTREGNMLGVQSLAWLGQTPPLRSSGVKVWIGKMGQNFQGTVK